MALMAQPETVALLFVLLGALVQGISGLGFALVAAPTLSVIFPGASGVGLVIVMGNIQAGTIALRTKARIDLKVLRAIAPPLGIGTALGIGVSLLMPDSWRSGVVISSAIISVTWLACERFIKLGRWENLLPLWGGVVNATTGVGGPPISSFLIHRVHDHESFIRTQQIVFITINTIALPALGVALPSWQFGVLAVAALFGGSAIGTYFRQSLGKQIGRRIAFTAIAGTAVYSIVATLT